MTVNISSSLDSLGACDKFVEYFGSKVKLLLRQSFNRVQ